MLNRRSFLQCSLATSLGGIAPATAVEKPSVEPPPYSPNEFERIVGMCDSIDVLGRPQSWSLVREGYHPISPERVIIMTDRGGDGWLNRSSRIENYLRSSLAEQRRLSALKLRLIFRLMRAMTDYYGVPHLFPKWATGLMEREALGSTGLGNGFGLLHQFQDDGNVVVRNAPVDWWLVLFPGGIEWDSWEPVYAMIGHVFPPRHQKLPGLKLTTWCLASIVGRRMDSDSWEWIAELDRINAAQTVNLSTLLALQSAGIK
jgi:hypothetical protein